MIPLVKNTKDAKYLDIWEKKFSKDAVKKECRNAYIFDFGYTIQKCKS